MSRSRPTCCAPTSRRSWCSTNGCAQAAARHPARSGGGRRGGRRVLVGASGPLVITGRGARQAGPSWSGCSTQPARSISTPRRAAASCPPSIPRSSAAVRAAAMTEADVVLLIGRKLDYQLGYGSPAVFPNARFIRIADNAGELIDNRRGEPELLAPRLALALAAMVEARATANAASTRPGPRGCAGAIASASAAAESAKDTPATGSDGKIHPACYFRRHRRHGRRTGLHRDRRRRRPAELRPHRPGGEHLHGCRRLWLPWRRRALRGRRGAGLSRTAR